MKSENKIYVYSFIAIALSVVGYFVISAKPKKENISSNESETDLGTENTEITFEQEQLPITLADIFSKSTALATASLKNKNIYSKIDNVKSRKSWFINDGLIDNVLGKVTSRNTNLGIITNVFEDSSQSKNKSGRIYKWVQVKLSPEAIKSINDADTSWTSFLKLNENQIYYVYFREDVISLTNKN